MIIFLPTSLSWGRKSRRLPLVNISHVSCKLRHIKTSIRCHRCAPGNLKCWHLSIAVWGTSAQFKVQFSALCSPHHYQWCRAPAVRCSQVTWAAMRRDLRSCRTLGVSLGGIEHPVRIVQKEGGCYSQEGNCRPRSSTQGSWGASQSQARCCFLRNWLPIGPTFETNNFWKSFNEILILSSTSN